MKKETYSELIDKIKRMQPIIEDPQGMTKEIMDRVNMVSKKNPEKKIYKMVACASSIAAAFLLVLFFFEFYVSENMGKGYPNRDFCFYFPKKEFFLNNENISGRKDFNHLIYTKKEKRKNQLAFYSSFNNIH